MNRNIVEFIEQQSEIFPDDFYGDGYKCSVFLKDGTYLPCVMLRESKKIVELALRRFEEEKKRECTCKGDKKAYRNVVKSFITSGNRIASFDVDRVEPSKYAFPLKLDKELQGETSMGWTGFVLEMSDGKLFQFGTSHLTEFFDLPEGYSFLDVTRIHNHSHVNQAGKLSSLRGNSECYNISNTFREKPYFDCYI